MFGHQDDESPQPATSAAHDDVSEGAVDAETIDTDRPSGEPAQPVTTDADSATADPATDSAATTTDASAPVDSDGQHPGTPTEDDKQPAISAVSDQSDQEQISDVISPAGGFPKRPSFQYQAGASDSLDSLGLKTDPSTSADDSTTRELIDIRQKALSELAPIIDKLDLPPLEKFRTIMMIIQVSDDEALVKAAYAAAHSIPDEKDKAQALLDIVNEVNYFTHQPEN